MPTADEMVELLYNCTWEWNALNGSPGFLVTSKRNGNSIFLPTGGVMEGSTVDYSMESGRYWSSSLNPDENIESFFLVFSRYSSMVRQGERHLGRLVRPVTE